jgi:non-specific serine/threonine protein kinase
MTFKGTKKTIPEIARQLNVQYVLEGSVRKSANNLRITVQLIDAANDAHLWAEKYSGTLDDVFDVQEKVSRAIVDALKLKLTPEERKKIADRPIDNIAAYQCYLKATAEIWRFEQYALDRARVHLQTGLAILGENALLYSTMAFVYFQYANIGAGQEDSIKKAEEYAQKAIAMNPNLPQAHFILGMINGAFCGNSREWIRLMKKALAVDPNYIDALRFLAGPYIISVGKFAAAEPLILRMQQIDPLDPWNYVLRGLSLLFEGKYSAAKEPLRKYYEADPDNPVAQFFYATNLIHMKLLDDAFSIIDRGAKNAPDNVTVKFGLLLKYALQNEKEKAFREITPEFQKTCLRDHQWSYFVALPLALIDAKEEALYWLEHAVNRGFLNYPDLQRNSHLDNLRGEERFKKLLVRVKKEWEEFEV